MKNKIVVLMWLVVAGPGFAEADKTQLSCKNIATAIAKKKVKKVAWTSHDENRQLEIAKAALILSKNETTQSLKDVKKLSQLDPEYDPQFSYILIDTDRFQVVDLSLGGNPYIYLFYEEGRFAHISSEDGSLVVRGRYCQGVESDPFGNI